MNTMIKQDPTQDYKSIYIQSKDVAKWFDIDLKYFRQHIASSIPAYTLSSQMTLYLYEDIEDWIEIHES